jgi:hypothetical protein
VGDLGEFGVDAEVPASNWSAVRCLGRVMTQLKLITGRLQKIKE